jgi:preprotein translocase subunit SecE
MAALRELEVVEVRLPDKMGIRYTLLSVVLVVVLAVVLVGIVDVAMVEHR